MVEQPLANDVIDAMKMHRMRLAKDQGLRPWEPKQSFVHASQTLQVAPADGADQLHHQVRIDLGHFLRFPL
jgi:hypothetical protein